MTWEKPAGEVRASVFPHARPCLIDVRFRGVSAGEFPKPKTRNNQPESKRPPDCGRDAVHTPPLFLKVHLLLLWTRCRPKSWMILRPCCNDSGRARNPEVSPATVASADIQSLVDHAPGEAPVRGFVHSAGGPQTGFMVLTHGAGGNSNVPLLVALAELFSASGISVLRCDLPYRQRRPHGPPGPSDAKGDQDGLLRAITLMKERFAGKAFLGGSSYGGRQASLLVASDPALVDGLLLLSYPLHPPGRPWQLRTAHFPNLKTPALLVSGTRDAFGSVEELQGALKLIPGRAKLVSIEGASHGLSQKPGSFDVPRIVLESFQAFFQ